MDRLLYVAMTGAKQLMQAQTLVSHNLANVSTNGFRADLARFEARPIQGPGYPSRINTVASGLGFDHSPGALQATDSPLDVAVEGNGYIAVQAPDGTEAMTRGGTLNVNALGLLETQRGELVLGDNGPLAIPPYTQISVGLDGTISITAQGQGPETLAQVGRIKLVNPEPEQLEKRPDGLVRLIGGGEVEADENVRLVAGFIESSNVRMADSLVDMIQISREFDVAVRMMSVADDNAERAATIARMS